MFSKGIFLTMAILYNLNTDKDRYVLGVSQDTLFKLEYILGSDEKLLIEKTLLADNTLILPITKDGNYKLTLIVEEEENLIIPLRVGLYLRNSVIKDALFLLCDSCNDCKGAASTSNCISKIANKALKFKANFVKLLTYHNLYLTSLSANYNRTFQQYVSESLRVTGCNTQALLNKYLQEECINGSVHNIDKLYKLHLAIYWAGMYFLEKRLTPEENLEQLEYLKTVFYYDKISQCICDSCIDMETLENIFNMPLTDFSIHSFQFNGADKTIEDVDLLNDTYLAANGNPQLITQLVNGKTITFGNVGRIGFVLYPILPDVYSIYDQFGNNVTSLVFDKVYDAVTLKEIYVSKEHYTPSSIYFKFVKN